MTQVLHFSKILLVSVELAEFAQAFRFPEVNVFQFGKRIQELRHVSVQQKYLFLAKLLECLAAGFSLPIDPVRSFGNHLGCRCIDAFCIRCIHPCFHRFAGTERPCGRCNADKKKW